MFWNFGDFINLDPDPDWLNFVDPDPETINPDPHHWYSVFLLITSVIIEIQNSKQKFGSVFHLEI